MKLSFIPKTQICLVDGIATDSDCDNLVEYIDWISRVIPSDNNNLFYQPHTEIDNYGNSSNTKTEFFTREMPNLYKTILNNLNNTVTEAVKEYFNNINTDTNTQYFFDGKFKIAHKHHEGSIGMGNHNDNGASTNTNENQTPVNDVIFGIVFYLNDNFSGGNLYYRDLDLTIEPKKGLLVIHPANLVHGVTQVVSGDRFSMTNFIYSKQPENYNTSS